MRELGFGRVRGPGEQVGVRRGQAACAELHIACAGNVDYWLTIDVHVRFVLVMFQTKE